MKKLTAFLLCLVILVSLTGCGSSAGSSGSGTAEPSAEPAAQSPEPTSQVSVSAGSEVTVSTVDELLNSIASDTIINLKAGVYELSSAESYASAGSSYYSWEENYDGSGLVLKGISGLTLRAEEGAEVTIRTLPRYADVLKFEDCSEITLENLTIGHTEGAGNCIGGVVNFDSCADAMLADCRLYGCGTIGIICSNSRYVVANRTEIYECSQGAIECSSSYDFRFLNGSVHDCGREGYYSELLSVSNSTGFAVVNSAITCNTTERFLCADYAQDVYLLGSQIEANGISDSFFEILGYSPVIEDCAFTDNTVNLWYNYTDSRVVLTALDRSGNNLYKQELLAMEQKEAEYDGPKTPLQSNTASMPVDVYEVETVDELLNAIGSHRTIYLKSELYRLSDASDYGAYRSGPCSWVDAFDGPGLCISGVEDLTIIGQMAEIQADPRYANVLSFENCSGITICDLTAGHSTEPGYCAGGVLWFSECSDITVSDCGLYGCGILGLQAQDCSGLQVDACYIYDCSEGAVNLAGCADVSFRNCKVSDCPQPELSFYECADVEWDGAALTEASYSMNLAGTAPAGVAELEAQGDWMMQYSVPDAEEEFFLKFEDFEGYSVSNVQWKVGFPETSESAEIRFKPGWLPFEVNDTYCTVDEDGYYTRLVSEGVSSSERPSAYKGMNQAFMIRAFYASQFADNGALLLQYAEPEEIEQFTLDSWEALALRASADGTAQNYLILYSRQYGYVLMICGEAPMEDMVKIAQSLEVNLTGNFLTADDFVCKYDWFDIAVG